MKTPDVEEAIHAVHQSNKGQSLWTSISEMGDMYMLLKNKGVDKENILDLIRIPFMFASMPENPEKVADAISQDPRN